MCSYMAMFPASLPHSVIRWLTKPGEVVYDPFSGRGTTPLEARLLGRVGLASDLNPLALVLSGAKSDPPSKHELAQRLAHLARNRHREDPRQVPEFVRMLFSDETLGELLWLRSTLSPGRRADRFLLGTLLGILHANADAQGHPRGLTIAMPNTFSMAPGYVSRFIRRHRLKPPRVSPLQMLEQRATALWRQLPSRGCVWHRDARAADTGPISRTPAKLLLTSPPYLHVIKYGKLNWVRLWLLGHDPKDVDGALFSSSSVTRYLSFMADVIRANAELIRDDGYMVLVIGDVRRPDGDLDLARAVAEQAVAGSGLRVMSVLVDRLPTKHKVSRIWGDTKGKATKTDRLLILGGRRAPRLPIFPEIEWTKEVPRGVRG